MWGDKMAYQWDSSLETGYEKVDKQHKQLVAAVNNLMEASQSGRGDSAVLETMDFLTGYAIKHFSDEENLMTMYEFPDFQNHKRLHDDFKVVVGDLTKRVANEGPTKELIEVVSTTVGSWLLNHIKGDDFRMAAFVKVADVGSAS
jgi:hemerythrin